jgi:hypothetical protein
VRGAEGKRISAAFKRGITADRVAQAVLRAYQCDITETVVPWDEPHVHCHAAFLAPFVIDFALRRLLRNIKRS